MDSLSIDYRFDVISALRRAKISKSHFSLLTSNSSPVNQPAYSL